LSTLWEPCPLGEWLHAQLTIQRQESSDHDDDEDKTDNDKQSGNSKSKAEIAAMAFVNDAATHYTDNNDSVEHLL
jgi:hypothetical protein